MIYEFKITLKHVGVPVWRKIQIDGNTTFYDFHRVLQVAFDWDNYHLHSFFAQKTNGERAGGQEITGEYHDDFGDVLGGNPSYNEKHEVISDWFSIPKDMVTYVYDFGDDWNHEIVFARKLQPEKDVVYPRCTGAKNIAPEEDTRGEVLMGEVDLALPDGKQLAKDVNEELRFQLNELLMSYDQTSAGDDKWYDVLSKAKEFQKLKPWDTLFDEHIFAVMDPVTQERLYCSVLGGAGEVFGLAVYIGDTGYRSLMNTLTTEEPDFQSVINQRSILLSYEDREDLEKEDYALIKSYDIPFRGRKSWPSFRSNKPGLYPWFMDDDEARLMLLGLERSIEVYHEVMNGLELPDMLFDEEMLVKVPREQNSGVVFDNQIVELEDREQELPNVTLAVSELDLKRMQKPKETLPATIEFSLEYMEMPVQNEENERPFFPLLVLAVEQTQGLAIYHNMLTAASNPASLIQSELLKVFESMNGIPGNIMVNHKTAHFLAPLIDKLNLNVEVEEDLPVIRQVMDMMHDDMLPF
ncbi:plasmid pRiA4b ORF-3 family protein [Lentibacillus salicampi]|nr:plasmid pRiA4b ORF-3 family protein [Lentibacillus salicampi]